MSARAARWKMRAGAGAGRIDRGGVGDIGLDDLNLGIALVLLEIGAAADDEIVEHPHTAALRQQAVDKMAADKPAPPVTRSKSILPAKTVFSY